VFQISGQEICFLIIALMSRQHGYAGVVSQRSQVLSTQLYGQILLLIRELWGFVVSSAICLLNPVLLIVCGGELIAA
jgi:hypothetical protein